MFTVVTQNIERLRPFSQLEHPSTFRYFKTRVLENAIKTHTYTVLYTDINADVGYGHIDKEGDRHYIGLCVMPSHQGKGIGKQILEMLLKESTTDLYLTVDDENTRAISLYIKYGFTRLDGRLYIRRKPLMLEVSVGEGLDKLTILDIKLDKISNEEKRSACKKEYDAIYPVLKPALDKCQFLYDCLKYINLQIWNLQDDVRDNKKEIPNLLNIILDLNDMRFRLKKRINQRVSSSLHEQKGYAERVGLFVGHMGMGDIINLNGAIRYASVQVDHLFVVCRKMFVDNLRSMIGDDPYIEIIPCENHVIDVFEIKNRKEINGRKITNWFISGNWLNWKRTYEDLPIPFYRDLQFPLEIRKSFFYYDRPANELSVPEVPYIFAHVTASSGSKINIENTRNLLIIDPNTNHYPEGHQFHNLAKQYVDKPIFTYGRVIENADEIHVTDSAFYCLACYLPLKATNKKCYNRETGEVSSQYIFQ